jgi:hypothetical protein
MADAAYEDRMTGAIIDSVEFDEGANLVTLTFRHRGTDDDSGVMVVHADAIHFGGDLD